MSLKHDIQRIDLASPHPTGLASPAQLRLYADGRPPAVAVQATCLHDTPWWGFDVAELWVAPNGHVVTVCAGKVYSFHVDPATVETLVRHGARRCGGVGEPAPGQ
ncbi:MAG: hypothetical protein KKA73_15015 [Chloroflexi bacterium]|nr:hypothetical protein [Chloroflexota bacterium]MBU1748998.1 hypothetical protein [Chloroflexota bacterium]